ncbi:MAG: SusC/RagA family TonB-linked outer membrane protein, partial [Bacteroidales bacterium]
QLAETVVIGFGTQKKEHVTGAASFRSMDKIIGDRPVVDAAQALQGVSPGLEVISRSGRPGDSRTSLNIRGFPSITGGQPLVLVDNVPMSLSDVNPRDIESVSVLKDASASSIYGARAAFGVILIETKKGSRQQPTQFDYSTTTSFSSPFEIPEKASTRDFVEALNDWGVHRYFANQEVGKWLDYIEQYENDPSSLDLIVDPVSGEPYPITKDPQSGIHYPLADSDVMGDFLNNSGILTVQDLTMSGGSENIAYRISAGYSYEDGIMVTSRDSYERVNLNANLNADLTPNLESSTSIFFRNSDRLNPVAQYGTAITENRMYDPTGHFELPNGDVLPFNTPGNIVRHRHPGQTQTQNLRIFQKLEYRFDALTLTGEYTYQGGRTKTLGFNNQPDFASRFLFELQSGDQDRTQYNRGYNDYIQHGINIYGDYEIDFDQHELGLMAGYNFENRENEGFSIYRRHMISTEVPGIDTGIGNYGGGDSHGAWAVVGYFSRLNYNYDDRYLLEGNARYDGSSRFAEDGRFGFFPSVSAGWNISNESFMEVVDQISSLRMRASWGEVGNQNIADLYPTYPGYPTPVIEWINLNNDERHVGIKPADLVSPLLTWESVQSKNIGLDIELLNHRLSASVDVYRRTTYDMLAPGRELPSVLGTRAPFTNAADLETDGWELELSWRDVQGNFNYGLDFNIYDHETVITKFDNPSGLIEDYYVGKSIGEIWGYETDGFYTVDDFVSGSLDADLSGPFRQLNSGVVQVEGAPTPFPGDVKYKDLNGDGMINPGDNTLENPGDRRIIGNSTPRYQFGINGFMSYQNWEFSFLLTGIGKRDLDLGGHIIWPYPSQFGHLYAHHMDYWMPDNQDSKYPRVHGNPLDGEGSNYSRSRFTQTAFLSDGRYLRVENITLSYTLPDHLISRLGVSSMRVHVAGNNIHTFHNLPKGLDPDQGDSGAYPFMRRLTAGVNLVF